MDSQLLLTSTTTPSAAAQSTNPFVRDSVCERPPANADSFGDNDDDEPDFGLFRKGKKLCIRCVYLLSLFWPLGKGKGGTS